MNNDNEDYYTKIEDLEEELPDRVIKDLGQISNQYIDDDSSSSFSLDDVIPQKKSENGSILLDSSMVFLITLSIFNKRLLKYISEFNISLPKNVIMAALVTLVFMLYKIILMVY